LISERRPCEAVLTMQPPSKQGADCRISRNFSEAQVRMTWSVTSSMVVSSLSLRWPRQRDPVENLADKKVSLNGGQASSYDRVVEPQTKQASRIA
jgi:hypothetical protein